ncbi:Glycine dehydrogenase [Gossypium australe]|uniref:Glycine dehydrogenase n=1 Tax=Gossypium australe TaxID=47621 RepID=A0A5B6X8Y3_9ROSI|nr:Glycine dehydrogenase [Gossypium australe]
MKKLETPAFALAYIHANCIIIIIIFLFLTAYVHRFEFNPISGMGTKLECAINTLPSSRNANSCCASTLHFVDDYFRTRELKKDFETPESQNMESIRETMQIHEDTFKHQVRELHRLYSVQKKSSRERIGYCSGDTMKIASLTSTVDVSQGSDDDYEVELTLSIGSSSRKKMENNSKSNSQIRELDSPSSFKSDSDKKRPYWQFQGFKHRQNLSNH